ncbi:MAG: lysophospholipid acyltransferase family protein [Syntrophales bacterium]
MNFKKELKYFVIRHLLTIPAYYFLRLYSSTIRLRFENAEVFQKHAAGGGRVIFACWHQRFFGGFYFPRLFNETPAIMISRSRDGDFISDIVERIGWIPVRGSSSRGGRKALNEIVGSIGELRLAVHIVDGPTGPPRVIKPGLITLAQRAKAAICPAYVSYERPWIVNSWDRFMIPRPFSRILIRFGSLEFIPEELNHDEFEHYRKKVEEILLAGYRDQDLFWDKEENRKNCRFLFQIRAKEGIPLTNPVSFH